MEMFYLYTHPFFNIPINKNKFYSKIKNTISNLFYFPEQYPKIENDTSDNIRKIVIDNYIIIYQVKKDARQVFLLHIFHYKQNYLKFYNSNF